MRKNIMEYIDNNPDLTEREVKVLLEDEYKRITEQAIENRIKKLNSERGSLLSRLKAFVYEITHIQFEI